MSRANSTNSFSFISIPTLLAALAAVSVHASATPVQLPVTPLPAPETSGWELLGDEDGIAVWRKEVEGSPIVAFRGEAVVEGSIAKVAQVLNDSSRKTEWVAKCEEAVDLEQINEFERVEYNHTGTPIVLKDRDFVFHSKVDIQKDKNQVVVSLRSVDHNKKPDNGDKVRGKLMNSRYILTALDRNKTRVLVEIHADPMGSVAKWIVNLFQKKWPRNTLEGIRAQVAKADVAEHPKVKEIFYGSK